MPAIPLGTTEDPVPIIGATLCLMTCVMQTGNTLYLARIADNLAILAEHPNVDANFRRICRRLFQHWEGCVNAQSDQPRTGESAMAPGPAPARRVH